MSNSDLSPAADLRISELAKLGCAAVDSLLADIARGREAPDLLDMARELDVVMREIRKTSNLL